MAEALASTFGDGPIAVSEVKLLSQHCSNGNLGLGVVLERSP